MEVQSRLNIHRFSVYILLTIIIEYSYKSLRFQNKLTKKYRNHAYMLLSYSFPNISILQQCVIYLSRLINQYQYLLLIQIHSLPLGFTYCTRQSLWFLSNTFYVSCIALPHIHIFSSPRKSPIFHQFIPSSTPGTTSSTPIAFISFPNQYHIICSFFH